VTEIQTTIKAGQSSTETDPIEDTYTAIYKLEGDSTWLLVTNFDKDRERQKPSLDVYHKATPAQK
jgi:hypothetical protein